MPEVVEAPIRDAGVQRVPQQVVHAVVAERGTGDDLVDSPFSGFVDVPPAVVAMHGRHAERIDAGIGQMREAYLVLLEDLVEAIWGVTSERSFSEGELSRHGYPGTRAA